MHKSQTESQVKMACGSEVDNVSGNKIPLSEEITIFTIKTNNSFESWEQSCKMYIVKTVTDWGTLKCISVARGLQNTWNLRFFRRCCILVPRGDFYFLSCTLLSLPGQVCLWDTCVR